MNITIEVTESESAGAFKKAVTKSIVVTVDDFELADDDSETKDSDESEP